MITVTRYHDISAGHRVYGHESKCKHLHGHNYRIHFEVTGPELDKQGRLMDFGVIKELLCMWLEDNWDHKMLLWEEDKDMRDLMNYAIDGSAYNRCELDETIVWVPFNPTAENMAKYLVEIVGPQQLKGTGCVLIKCTVEETRKCSASYTLFFTAFEEGKSLADLLVGAVNDSLKVELPPEDLYHYDFPF